MNVYFISGVGADRRIFRNIRLPEGYHEHHLDWIKPLPRESLQAYAHRLADSIDKREPFILIGLSFGGMLANEIDKLIPAQKVILISSVPSSKQLPPWFKFAGFLNLQNLVPVSFYKSMSILKRLFTAETAEEKKYLRKAIREADSSFIKWSLNAIVKWRCDSKPKNYVHIQGSRDLILPTVCSGYTHLIKGGGHLMILTQAKEINRIIAEELPKLAGGRRNWERSTEKEYRAKGGES